MVLVNVWSPKRLYDPFKQVYNEIGYGRVGRRHNEDLKKVCTKKKGATVLGQAVAQEMRGNGTLKQLDS